MLTPTEFITPPEQRKKKAEKGSRFALAYLALVLCLAFTALGCTAFRFLLPA